MIVVVDSQFKAVFETPMFSAVLCQGPAVDPAVPDWELASTIIMAPLLFALHPFIMNSSSSLSANNEAFLDWYRQPNLAVDTNNNARAPGIIQHTERLGRNFQYPHD